MTDKQSKSLKQRTLMWNCLWPLLEKHYKREKTFLDHTNVWELLIAVILSAQTSDNGVNKVTPTLFAQYPTPEALMDGDPSDIAKVIHSIGHFNAKTRYIQATAQRIVEDFRGEVPDDEPSLRSLPGVGRKTAVVVLANGFNRHVGIAVDTHVIRFAHRFALSDHKDPNKIEQDLVQIIPQHLWTRASYAIKEYGRKEGKASGYNPDLDPLWKAFVEHQSRNSKRRSEQ